MLFIVNIMRYPASGITGNIRQDSDSVVLHDVMVEFVKTGYILCEFTPKNRHTVRDSINVMAM